MHKKQLASNADCGEEIQPPDADYQHILVAILCCFVIQYISMYIVADGPIYIVS